MPMQRRTASSNQQSSLPVTQALPYDWRWMLKSILGRPLVVLSIPMICVLLGVLFVALRPGQYTATTTLNVTNLRLALGRDDAFYAEAQFDPTFLETQIQIISSETVVNEVLRTLDGEPAAQTPHPLDAQVLQDMLRPLGVARVGLSNLVNISYTASEPQKAAEMANAFARAYLDKLNRDRQDAAEAGSSWLRDRLQEVGPKAQVVTEALAPVNKSNLRGIYIIAAAGAVGLMSGMIAALGLAFLDRRIRTPEQIVSVLGAPCLGMVSTLAGNRDTLMRRTVDHPFTELWHTLHHASVALQERQGSSKARMIGVTSFRTGDGASTCAANLARMNAAAGKSVLLIDAQPYDRQLTEFFTPATRTGLIDMLGIANGTLASAIFIDPVSGVSFLPLDRGDTPEKSAQLLWSPAMDSLFPALERYDMVIFDLPPLSATADLQAAARRLDGIVLVLGWGEADEDAVETAIRLNPVVHDRLLGVILNKVDVGAMRRVFSPFAAAFTSRAAVKATYAQTKAALKSVKAA
jgi:succinoglycan biosynthesis transport protein ExoP